MSINVTNYYKSEEIERRNTINKSFIDIVNQLINNKQIDTISKNMLSLKKGLSDIS